MSQSRLKKLSEFVWKGQFGFTVHESHQPGVLVMMCGGRRVGGRKAEEEGERGEMKARLGGGGGGGGLCSQTGTSAFLSVTVDTDKAASSGPIWSLLTLQNVHSVLPLSGEEPYAVSPPCFDPGRGRRWMSLGLECSLMLGRLFQPYLLFFHRYLRPRHWQLMRGTGLISTHVYHKM